MPTNTLNQLRQQVPAVAPSGRDTGIRGGLAAMEGINPLRWHSPGATFGLAWRDSPILRRCRGPYRRILRGGGGQPPRNRPSSAGSVLGERAPGAFGRKRYAKRGTAAGPLPHHNGIMRTLAVIVAIALLYTACNVVAAIG